MLVMFVAIACWTAGSWAKGATVWTYRSVSVTSPRAHTDTMETGASREPSTIRMTAPAVRP